MGMNVVHKVVYLMSSWREQGQGVQPCETSKLLPFAEYGYVQKTSSETRVSETNIQVSVNLKVSWEHNADDGLTDGVCWQDRKRFGAAASCFESAH
eukprot:23438-Amphidinium_carterae.2